jgi:hypothetical protein
MRSGFFVSKGNKIWVGMLRTASTQRSDSRFEGHSALSTTQRYIDADALAQRKVVELV